MKTLTVMGLVMLTASVNAGINVPHPLSIVQPVVVRACTNMGLVPSGVIQLDGTSRLDFTMERYDHGDRVVFKFQLVLIGEGDSTRIVLNGRMLTLGKSGQIITRDVGEIAHDDPIDLPQWERVFTDAINAAWGK